MKSKFRIFLSVVIMLCMAISLLPMSAFAADTRPPHNHCSCGLETDVCDDEDGLDDHHKDPLFPIWESDTRMPLLDEMAPDSSGGHVLSPKVYYYLVHDVDMSDTWEVQNEGRSCNVTVCLYDHTITNGNSDEETPVIEIWKYGRLYLTTCGRRSMDGDAEITHAEGTFGSGVQVGSELPSGTKSGGYFYMYGGNIVRNTAGGVVVNEKGKFEMYRGTITDNTNDTEGLYEVYNNTGASFKMYGGTISANSNTAISNYGSMAVSGGYISGYNGIHNFGGGTLALSGSPEISGTSGIDIFCYSTEAEQIDADGYIGDTLTIAIPEENLETMNHTIIVKNAKADKFTLVNSVDGQPHQNYWLAKSGNDLILTDGSWPTELKGKSGELLNTVKLPDGFAWKQPDQIVEYGRREYEMYYQPDGQEKLVTVVGIDAIPPTGTISIGGKTWNSFIEKDNIRINVFYNTKQTVKITAQDEEYGSGLKEVCYYLSTDAKTKSELKNMAISCWTKDIYEFNIQPNKEYIIYVRISDQDNESFISSGGIVLDNKAPVISGITDGGAYFGNIT